MIYQSTEFREFSYSDSCELKFVEIRRGKVNFSTFIDDCSPCFENLLRSKDKFLASLEQVAFFGICYIFPAIALVPLNWVADIFRTCTTLSVFLLQGVCLSFSLSHTHMQADICIICFDKSR